MRVLKEDNGLWLIRSIDSRCYELIIKICAQVNAPDYQTLKALLDKIRSIFIKDWDYVD